jgi:hypothetical protein
MKRDPHARKWREIERNVGYVSRQESLNRYYAEERGMTPMPSIHGLKTKESSIVGNVNSGDNFGVNPGGWGAPTCSARRGADDVSDDTGDDDMERLGGSWTADDDDY